MAFVLMALDIGRVTVEENYTVEGHKLLGHESHVPLRFSQV